MSCFRILKMVMKKLTSALHNFGGVQEVILEECTENHGINYAFQRMNEGLGFKDLTHFNTSMIGKQIWRLIEKPNTLFSRVFKGRYFRNASPLELIRSYSSYGWCIIVFVRSLVSKRLIKRVGTRSSISVWNDPWLPSTRPRPANKNQHNLYPELTVDALIDGTSRSWNLQVIRTLVDPQDVKIIESIPISRFHLEDRNGWHFTNNGKYTVKSGYEVERVYPDRESMPPQFGPSITPLKAFCWKVRCPPKMKHFFMANFNWVYSG